jgi:uncharacterized beta-barrel protein YwiB (DUF1934 family)
MQARRKKDVIVSVQGCRLSPEPQDSCLVDWTTDGSMVAHRHGYMVSYREPYEDGDTTLLIENGRVTMLRSGKRTTQMVFEEGCRHLSYQDTSEGSMTVGVTASRVTAEIGDEGGHIEMVYGVEIAGDFTEESHVSIDIHAASGTWNSIPDGLTIYRDMFIN